MSFELAGQVWHLQLEQPLKFVLLALADFAGEDHTCWPSVATIAYKTEYSERQVQRILKSLKEMKVVLEHGKYKGKSIVYRIDIEHVPVKPKRPKHTNEVPEPLTKCHPRQNVTGDTMSPLPVTFATSEPPQTGDILSPDPVTVTEPTKEPSPAGAVGVPVGEVSPEVSEHRRFTDSWVSSYKQRFKSKYFFNGPKDGSAVSRLLAAGESVDGLMETAQKAWAELGTGFLYQQSTTIAGFASKLNEIRAVLANPGSATQKPTWMEIRDLEQERKPLAATLDEYNELLRHDANRTQENIDVRKKARERVEQIDARLKELRA